MRVSGYWVGLGIVTRHGSLNSLFQVALYLPSYKTGEIRREGARQEHVAGARQAHRDGLPENGLSPTLNPKSEQPEPRILKVSEDGVP